MPNLICRIGFTTNYCQKAEIFRSEKLKSRQEDRNHITKEEQSVYKSLFFFIEERASNHSSGHLVQVLIEHASFFRQMT